MPTKKEYYSMLHKLGTDNDSLGVIKKVELADIILKAVASAFIVCVLVAIVVMAVITTKISELIAISTMTAIGLGLIFLGAFVASALVGSTIAICGAKVKKNKR